MEELILQVRLIIGDISGSPFYPLLTDEQYVTIITMNANDVFASARMAGFTAASMLSGYNTRERTGDIEVYNNLSTAYLAVLKERIKSPNTALPIALAGLAPWMEIGCPNPLSNITTCADTSLEGCLPCTSTSLEDL